MLSSPSNHLKESSSSTSSSIHSDKKAEAIRYFNEFKMTDSTDAEKIKKAAERGHAEARRLLAQEYHQLFICRDDKCSISKEEARSEASRLMCSLLEEKPQDFGDAKLSEDDEAFYVKHDKKLFSTAFAIMSHSSMLADFRLNFSFLVALPHSEKDVSLQNLLVTITDETLKLYPNSDLCRLLGNIIRPLTIISIDFRYRVIVLRNAIELINENPIQLVHYIIQLCNEGGDPERIICGLLRFMSLQCRTTVHNTLFQILADAAHPRIDSGVSSFKLFLPRGITSLITSYGSHNEKIDLVLSYLNGSQRSAACMSSSKKKI